jgi:hypothetical protein
MKRAWIVLLAALFLALGAILWEFGRAIPLLIWIAMQPAGWGCDEGPVTDQSATNARGDVVEEYINPHSPDEASFHFDSGAIQL